jgi:putative transcriptional regulator
MERNKYVPSTILALKISRVFEKEVAAIFQLEEDD